MKKINNCIQVTKSFLPPIEEYTKMIRRIWDNNWLTNNGPLHNELSIKLAKYLKINDSTLFTNGHLALDSALKLLNLKGEVITTPFTFASTTHAIVMNGLTPVFCDINLNDYTIDVEKIEELITEKTVAIVPVHVFGYPCNVDKIQKIANKYNLKVIYDAAHAFGVEVNGVGISNYGDLSMFSLHATKVYNSIEGGLLTYNNEEYKRKLDEIKNFGITGPESVESVGLNAKMNEFQAAMGLLNLKYIDEQIAKRKFIADIYRENLSEIKGIEYLNDLENVKHNYSYFPILVDKQVVGLNRDELHEELKSFNILTRKYFYPLVTDFDCYKGKFDESNLDNAKFVANRVLTLPMYSELKKEECLYICECIKKAIKNNNDRSI